MKNSFLILVMVLLLTSCASKTAFSSFYADNKKDCDFSISSPAFVANLFIPKEDVKEYKDLFKKVKHYKIMVFSEASKNLDNRFNRFMKQQNYVSIFRINQNGEQVQLYFLQNKDVIKEIVLKVKSDNDYVLLGLKTNLSEQDFNRIIEDSTIELTSN